MAKPTKAETLRHLGGTAIEIARDLEAYSNAAQVLSSNHPRLIDDHPLQWVGVYQGAVAASGKNLTSLMIQLEKAGVPPARTIIRFIDKEERILIL